MHVQSTVNNLTHDDVPVALFSLEDKHKLLLVEQSYEDMVQKVQTKFGLKGLNVVFRISTLDICKGRSVDIDADVYPAIRSVLDEVSVCVDKSRSYVVEKPISKDKGRAKQEADVNTLFASNTPPLSTEGESEDGETDRAATAAPSKRARSIVLETSSTMTNKDKQLRANKPDNIKRAQSTASEGLVKVIKDEVLTMKVEESVPDVATPKFRVAKPKPTENKKTDNGSSSSLMPGSSQDSAEARFNVTIVGPNDARCDFKTRSGHLAGKVLMGACKTFQLDKDAHRLCLLTESPDGDSEVLVHCNNEDTLARCGIGEGSVLVVEPDEDDMDSFDELED